MTLADWYELRFGIMTPIELGFRHDGTLPHVRYGWRDHQGRTLTNFAGLTLPG